MFAHILNLVVQNILKLLKCESSEENTFNQYYTSETDSDSDSEQDDKVEDFGSVTSSTVVFKLRKTYTKIRNS